MSGYALHPDALADLDELWEYIAGNSIDAADRVVDEIFTALPTLVSFPYSGHRRPDLTSRPLRFRRVRDFLIVYAPDERPLWVVAVLHGRRNPRVMAALLRGREERPR
jgi:plasmid stabilization system protein ParE